jgi:ABC-type glycerol-3-phosphate transport system permease component
MRVGIASQSRRTQVRKTLDFVIAFLLCALVIFPLSWMVISSFKSETEIYSVPPTFFPEQWSLEGYQLLFLYTKFLRYFVNTFIVALSAAVLAILLSIGGVYGVTRFRFMGAQLFTFLILMIYMLPPILLTIPLFTLWVQVGLADNLLSLSLSYVAITFPFALWMSRSYFGTIPLELEEAAMVDGATRFQAFVRITVPQALPGLIATFIFTFILAWNEYVLALVLLSSDENYTVSLGVANLIASIAVYSWPLVTAAGTLATIPILILFFFVQRRLVSGMSAGALAGQ